MKEIRRVKIEELDSYILEKPKLKFGWEVVNNLPYERLIAGNMSFYRELPEQIDINSGFTLAITSHDSEGNNSIKPFSQFNEDYDLSSLDSVLKTMGGGILYSNKIIGCGQIHLMLNSGIDNDDNYFYFKKPETLFDRIKELGFVLQESRFHIRDDKKGNDFHILFNRALTGIQSNNYAVDVNAEAKEWFFDIAKKHYKTIEIVK